MTESHKFIEHVDWCAEVLGQILPTDCDFRVEHTIRVKRRGKYREYRRELKIQIDRGDEQFNTAGEDFPTMLNRVRDHFDIPEEKPS